MREGGGESECFLPLDAHIGSTTGSQSSTLKGVDIITVAEVVPIL